MSYDDHFYSQGEVAGDVEIYHEPDCDCKRCCARNRGYRHPFEGRSKPLTGKARIIANNKKRLRQQEVRANYTPEQREKERIQNRDRNRRTRDAKRNPQSPNNAGK